MNQILASYLSQSIIALLGLCASSAVFLYRRHRGRDTLKVTRKRSFTLSLGEGSSTKVQEEMEEPSDQYSILVFVLTEFHKAQCSFAIALQLASFVVVFGTRRTLDYVDESLLLLVSADGLIPIVLNLYTLMVYGRKSWL